VGHGQLWLYWIFVKLVALKLVQEKLVSLRQLVQEKHVAIQQLAQEKLGGSPVGLGKTCGSQVGHGQLWLY
jgi:hypothetical protein